jgi:hypothetical protein
MLYNDAYASKTVQRWEHTFPLIGPLAPDSWQIGAVVELARVNIPHGYYAEIQRIDTTIQDITTGKPLSSWDNPETFDPSFQFCLGYSGVNDRWFNNNNDRAVLFDASTEPWFNRVGCNPLPGLPFWKDGRYQWGNQSNEMQLPTGDQIVVRLFVNCIAATAYLHRTKGRLIVGYSLKNTREAQERAMI